MMTFENRIILTKGRSTGFNYMRLILSVSVIVFHTVLVCYGEAAEKQFWMTPLRPLYYFVVPAFFALAGFLIAGSWDRVRSIPVYLTLRALRIFPALMAEVTISALIIGPLLTDLPWSSYFSHGEFWSYFQNVTGNIHYFLPGVFTHNPVSVVSRQLWTIPFELKCDVYFVLLAILTMTSRPRLLAVFAVVFNIFAFYYNRSLLHDYYAPLGTFLASCFLWGTYLYVDRRRIPHSPWLCAAAVAIAWVTISWSQETAYLSALPMAYVTAYLGLLNPPRTRLIAGTDISYGLYLYGFPVQQAVVDLFPAHRVWYFNLLVSLPVSALFAWASWTWLEGPILARKSMASRRVEAACKLVWTPVRAAFRFPLLSLAKRNRYLPGA